MQITDGYWTLEIHFHNKNDKGIFYTNPNPDPSPSSI